MKYKSKPLFIDSMGSVPSFNVENKATETKEEELLWHINKMREHDGLKPFSLDYLIGEYRPVFTPIEDWQA